MGTYTSKYTGEQIDNLLGQVENGGGAGGSSGVTLWQGSLNTAGQTATLSESLENFDHLLIKSNITNANNVRRYMSANLVATNDIKNIYGTSEKIITDNFYDASATTSLLIYVGFEDPTTMSLYAINKKGTINSYTITEIIGINLLSGGNSTGESNPTGTIISFMGLVAPNGYLICDGSELNISEYGNLANHFETQFGTKNHFGGDGTTTFALPDLRNEFLRGYHGDKEEQLSGEVGIHQEATKFPTVCGTSAIGMATDGTEKYDIMTGKDSESTTSVKNKYATTTQGSDAFPSWFTSRPTNVAVLYCIKY